MEIIFILVEPAVPENIGAAARAVKTMGFKQLRIINPLTDDQEKIRTVAHASKDILDQAGYFPGFDEATSDLDFLVASSAKKRRTNEEYLPADQLYDFILEKGSFLGKTGLVFGREESGLTNEEIKKCDVITYIPMIEPYPSLNLSHAVMIYAYLLSGLKAIKKKPEILSDESLQALKGKVGKIVEHINLKQPHIIGPRLMERLTFLKEEDLSLLHSICNAYIHKHKL